MFSIPCVAMLVSAVSLVLNGCGHGGGGGSGFQPTGLTGIFQPGVSAQSAAYTGNPVALNSGKLPPAVPSPQSNFDYSIAVNQQQLSTDYSHQFGLGAEVSVDGLFSGSAEYQRSREQVNDDVSIQINGEVSAQRITSVVNVPASWYINMSNSGVSSDLERLPTSVSNDTLQYFVDFFNLYGTHRLKTVTLGGKMHMTFSAALDRSNTTSDDQSSFSLGAQGTFLTTIGALTVFPQFQWSNEDANKQSFSNCALDVDYTAVGGDNSTKSWADWWQTVAGSEVAIAHEYGVWDDVVHEVGTQEGWSIDREDQLNDALTLALQMYLTACPDACSGHGYCSFSLKQCLCDETYQGESCSQRTCPTDCGYHGSCDESTHNCVCGSLSLPGLDPRSPCQIDCGPVTFSSFVNDNHPCVEMSHGHILNPYALEYPYDDHQCSPDEQQQQQGENFTGHRPNSYYCCIPVGANQEGDDPKIAANLYCQEMVKQGLVAPGAESTGSLLYSTANPVCSYGSLGCTWCRGYRLGNRQAVDVDYHVGGMPIYEPIFASITCTPPTDCVAPADNNHAIGAMTI